MKTKMLGAANPGTRYRDRPRVGGSGCAEKGIHHCPGRRYQSNAVRGIREAVAGDHREVRRPVPRARGAHGHARGNACAKPCRHRRYPSFERAQAFFSSPEYQQAKKLREGAASAQFIAVEGQ